MPATHELNVRLDSGTHHATAVVQTGEGWVSLHSRRDPVAEAARQVADVPADAPLVVVIGLGLGFAIDALEARGWRGRVLAFEPLPALLPLMRERRDWATWGNRLQVVPLAAEDSPVDLWRAFDGRSPLPALIVNPVVARVAPGAVARAQALVARAHADACANEEARRVNAGRYLLNTLRNRTAIGAESTAAALNGVLAGRTALVVGAGPSLDANLPAILAARDKVVVIAVDTALRPLLAAGVHPDLVVGIDPTEANALHLCDLPLPPRSWLVAEASLDPEGLRAFVGRTFFCRVGTHHPWPWLQAAGVDAGLVRAWGSVLTTATDIALRAGANPIIFAGADLAFTDGQPYARGTANEEAWARDMAQGLALDEVWRTQVERWAPFPEPGVGGRLELTASHLRAFRDWIVEQATRDTSRTWINGSGRGILVGPSFRQQDLAKALAALPTLAGDPHGDIAAAWRSHRASAHASPPPNAETHRAWQDAVPGVTMDDVSRALGTPVPIAAPPGADPLSTAAARFPDLAPWLTYGDAEALLAATGPGGHERVEIVICGHPLSSLEARCAPIVEGLERGALVALVDATTEGGHVLAARTVESLLCVRDDIAWDCRRFVDHRSRLSLVWRTPAPTTATWTEADRAKRGPAEAETATRLVEIVMAVLRPESVVDLGCGDGAWTDAFRRAGVAHVQPVVAADLPTLQTRAHLAVCLEIAHELPPTAQDVLIERCVATADTVLFSSRVPGTPGASGVARPLQYWAARFRRHGYVLDDCIAPVRELSTGLPRATADLMVVFRRAAAPGSLEQAIAGATRVHDLRMQAVWLQIERAIGQGRAPVTPLEETALLPLVPARMAAGAPAGRRVVLRSTEGRWVASLPDALFAVLEDDRPLREVHPRSILQHAVGVWHREGVEFAFVSSDGTDPRHNGRRYALRVPAHVARAEMAWGKPAATSPSIVAQSRTNAADSL